ncbi:MAG: hypothetical protein V7K77_13945 [Nostoc sp.]|uniref:hypothetical protein n=1 Tax=Nostoc sp. TaxID=1180 RepID=UPI002FF8B22B
MVCWVLCLNPTYKIGRSLQYSSQDYATPAFNHSSKEPWRTAALNLVRVFGLVVIFFTTLLMMRSLAGIDCDEYLKFPFEIEPILLYSVNNQLVMKEEIVHQHFPYV